MVKAKTQTSRLTKPQRPNLNDQSGFTLIEILVALFIVAIVYASISLGTDSASSNRNQLDKAMELVERGIRFASNESILRGSLVRIRFKLDDESVHYVIEYGPKDGFVLPDFKKEKKPEDMSKEELEEWEEKISNVDKNFIGVEDLEQSQTTFPENIRIMGIGTNLSESFSDSGSPSFYFYPTGEKDDFLFVVAGDEEVAALKAGPFSEEIIKEYFTLIVPELAEDKEEALLNAQDSMLKEVYENWLRDD